MSNGSERMPERCVHAPDGPDWAGLRELPTPKPDYEALVGRVRDDYSCTDALHRSLADAVESLLVENGRLREEWADADALAQVNAMNMADWVAMREERDALRTQLDSMTVEWGIQRDEATPQPSREWAERAIQRQRSLKGGFAIKNQSLVKRLVSPWTVVEGEQK